MHRFLFIVFVIFLILCACGVEKEEEDTYSQLLTGWGEPAGEAPDLSGRWTVILLPLETTCIDIDAPPEEWEGFAIYSPIDIPKVKQNGNNLEASFELDGQKVSLSGVVYGGYITATLRMWSFIETIGGEAKSPSFYGVFNGQGLGSVDCMEGGVFVASVGSVETPSLAGEWTITLSGVAKNCTDPGDEGSFEETIENIPIENIPINQIEEGTVGGTFEYPAGVNNIIGGVALGKAFAGGISEEAIPPERYAILLGDIYPEKRKVAGELQGSLPFPGGECEVKKGQFKIFY